MYKLVFIGLLFSVLSCNGQKDKKQNTYKVMEYQYLTDQRPSYGIEFNTTLKCELWVNDVPFSRNHRISQKSDSEIVNDLLLGNGEQTFTLKLFPNHKDSLITQEDMKWTKMKLVRVEMVPGSIYGETKNREELYDFEVPKIQQPVPYIEVTGKYTIEDLPYNLVGWKNSQDLSKMDQELLLKDIVSYYKFYRELLNDGDVKQTLLEENQKNNEVAIATYDDPNWYLGEKSKNDILKFKGTTLPIENYKLEIFGNGRLATLIRADKFFPWDVIIMETETSWFYSGVIIHKPIGSDSFKIIRK